MTTIKELLEKPIGKEYRTGGFQLAIKTARKMVDIDNKILQGVVFIDDTGEIQGEVSLQRHIPLQRTQKIYLTICWLQNGEKGKKLYVEQWYPVTITEAELGCKYQPDWGPEDSEAMEWAAARREEVKGKVRHGVVCAMIQAQDLDWELAQKHKDNINKIVEFIVTGE